MDTMRYLYTLLFLIVIIGAPLSHIQAASLVLNSEEKAWLKSNNNTITVIPERNNPPFSFNDTSWNTQGIFIDYINLVADKLNAKVDYLTARTRVDVIDGLKQGGGAYIGNLGADKAKELSLPYSTAYFTAPVVIITRNDYYSGTGMTLDDLDGKSVSVLAGSVVESYLKKTHPKIIVTSTFDSELVLQKVVLAEVDAGVINLASLSYFMSKQSIKSIKVVGNIPDLDVNLAFTTSSNQQILNSILEKGLAQITEKERETILNKWQDFPTQSVDKKVSSFPILALYVISILGIFVMVFVIVKSKRQKQYIPKKGHSGSKLEEDIVLLENINSMLVKKLEQDIKENIEETEK
jgi:ABC-type amino acid transport substrate-binding protein